MTKQRWELKDTVHPDWRGQRFSSRERAEKELAQAVPPGRFVLVDRETGEVVKG